MQRINFYSTELLPQRERLDFRQMLFVLPVFLLLLIAITFYQRGLLQQEKQQSLAARESMQTVLEQISQLSAQHVPNARPVNIEELRLRLAQQKKLLAELAAQDWSDRGFSDILNSLAMQAEPSIWLTVIGVDKNAVQLKGATLKPENIPDWLARLQQQAALSDVHFTQLQLLRDDNKPIVNFEVKSSPALSTRLVAP